MQTQNTDNGYLEPIRIHASLKRSETHFAFVLFEESENFKTSLWKKCRERRERGDETWKSLGGWDVNKKEARRGPFFASGLLSPLNKPLLLYNLVKLVHTYNYFLLFI